MQNGRRLSHIGEAFRQFRFLGVFIVCTYAGSWLYVAGINISISFSTITTTKCNNDNPLNNYQQSVLIYCINLHYKTKTVRQRMMQRHKHTGAKLGLEQRKNRWHRDLELTDIHAWEKQVLPLNEFRNPSGNLASKFHLLMSCLEYHSDHIHTSSGSLKLKAFHSSMFVFKIITCSNMF